MVNAASNSARRLPSTRPVNGIDHIESILHQPPDFTDAQIADITATCTTPIPQDPFDLQLMQGHDEIWIPRSRKVPRLQALRHRLRESFLRYLIRGSLENQRSSALGLENYAQLRRAIERIERTLALDGNASELEAPLAHTILRAALSRHDGRRGDRSMVSNNLVDPVIADTLSGLDAFEAALASVKSIREWVHLAERRNRASKVPSKGPVAKSFEKLISDLANIWVNVLGQVLSRNSGGLPTAAAERRARHLAFVRFIQAAFHAIGIHQRHDDLAATVDYLHRRRKLTCAANAASTMPAASPQATTSSARSKA